MTSKIPTAGYKDWICTADECSSVKFQPMCIANGIKIENVFT